MKDSFKPTIIYFSLDCFTQVDDTVLHHLTNDFTVVWFYYYESLKENEMRYNPKKAKDYADKYGITLEVVNSNMRRRDIRNYLFFKDVAHKINSYNPHLVYSCCIFPFWFYCKPLIKCPIKVLGVHDVISHSYSFSISRLLNSKVNELLMRSFKHIFTFSTNQHDLLLSNYRKESCMVGMSVKDFGTTDKVPTLIKDGIKLLFFGSIHPYKGLDLLIVALERLISMGVKNVSLTIAGKGPDWERYSKLINSFDFYDLQIRFIDNSEIPNLMASHHFLVLPYRNATQSGPLMTAIAYNLPIIAPNYGCFSEYYDNKSAVLYKKGCLLEALYKIANISQKEYDDMRLSTNIIKERYSEMNVAKNYIDFFSELYGMYE